MSYRPNLGLTIRDESLEHNVLVIRPFLCIVRLIDLPIHFCLIICNLT